MFNPLYSLHKQPLLRRLLLPVLARLNLGDITIKHHYADQRLRLHSFRHKGYWFHGRRRERETMDFFRHAIRGGDTIVEVGGHIGYLSIYFSHLAGDGGGVLVFEPGSNNLPYLRQNVQGLDNVEVIEKAVSNQDGVAHFYEEPLTGQNNSLHADYDVFSKNRERAFADAEYQQCEVETVTLDTFLPQAGLVPDLVKIDIEGAELMALQGALSTIRTHLPILMVEVTNQKREVYDLLTGWGYSLYSDTGQRLTTPEHLDFNCCALYQEKHAEVLRRCGWDQRRAAA